MKTRAFFVLLFIVASAFADDPYDRAKEAAEKFYAEGSYVKSHETYTQMQNLSSVPAVEARWLSFRLADTEWRAAAATDNADTTKLDEARDRLEKQIRDLTRNDQHDRIWAEVQESLGDFFWVRRNRHDWNAARPHYQAALDWWAGTADIETARLRYLDIVWRMAQPPRTEPYYYYGYWGNSIPQQILENALKISRSAEDQAHAHYLLAMNLRNQSSDPESRARVADEFEAAMKFGKKTDWYDDALYNYASWAEGQGKVVPLAAGGWAVEPDYVKALELFRRMTNEFTKGETRYWDDAKNQIQNITDSQVSVSVGTVFLPDSEIQYILNWRNVKKVELALYAVKLNEAVNFPTETRDSADWLHSINLDNQEKIKSWPHETKDADDYQPGNETLRLNKLKPGAYIIEASADGKTARDLILVSEAALVLKNSGKQALVYFCNALDGSPVKSGKVKFWTRWWENDRWHAISETKETDTNGIAIFQVKHPSNNNNVDLFVSAIRDDRQAFSPGNNYWYSRETERWKIYAFTDRPAYRPKETVNWKFIARRYDGSVYSTPANETIWYQLRGPDNSLVKESELKINPFGSVSGSQELTEAMRLGEYNVSFYDDKDHNQQLGSATLFRLEEYKLPEFKVAVTTPEENGQKKSFKLGDTVEAEIRADYYFGGPVANADVEIIVHQNPFWHSWHPPREFPWFYEDLDNGNSSYGRYGRWYGGDQIIKRDTVKTDAAGRAHVSFETPRGAGQDYEYRIEARVTDSSRREIIGNGSVRVTRQRYYVDATAAHNLYRPQDKVTVDLHALDANDQPVQAEGKVTVTRDYWFEIWLAPDGHEVKGNELKRLQAREKIWPPRPPKPNLPGWTLKFRGYQHEEILMRTLKTDTNGAAQLEFRPEQDGYYRIAWTSEDTIAKSKFQVANPITAETTVWVVKNSTTELGYRHGGVEIIADKDTFGVGCDAPIMFVAPTADRYVLFTIEGDDLYHYQLIHMDGTVKLVNLHVEEKYVPNMFLNATLMSDREMFVDSKQIIVPPVKNFLTVDVKPDAAQHQPRENGTFTVTTKNDKGEPVSAEVALSLVDASVFYIQSDYAGDPRQFYFGTKRQQLIHTQSTMNQKSYAKLVEGEQEQLVDERDLARAERSREESLFSNDALADRNELEGLERKKEINGFGGSGGDNRFVGQSVYSVGGVMTATPAAARVPILGELPVAGELTKSFSRAISPPMGSPAGTETAVVVRSDFRSTIFWQPDIITGLDGKATVKMTYPDSLTSWTATARAVTEANQFGIASTNTRTKQPLIVRLEAPRFFVVGDTVTISAVINNNTYTELTVRPELEVGGALTGTRIEPASSLKVSPNNESRADWTLKISRPGEVKLKAAARGGKFADAMEKTFTAYEHGIEKFISKSGKSRANDLTVKLDLPHERKADSTSLTVQVTPSMAVTMLDALPYLINYPYGCTEQTMSRFLPTVITAKTLRDTGLDPEDVMGRLFGGIETNSAAATHPQGKKNLDEMNKMTEASLNRLYDFQHGDGGWGWWKEGESDHWMTAYVVWGLSLAHSAEISVKMEALNRGVAYLDKELVEEEENYDMQAFMLHALAAYFASTDISTRQNPPPALQAKAFDNLWKNRDKLNAYTRALLALSAHDFRKTVEAKTLVENLENGVVRDDRPDESILIGNIQQPTSNNQQPVLGTAHWGNDGIYWRWSDGGVEATAFALRAMLVIDPTNKLIEPTANWLIKNRRGAQWNNTRDTAIVVLAMNDYLRVSGELKPEMEYEVFVNGTSVATKKISGADVFNAPSRFMIDPKLIKDVNEIRFKMIQGSTESRPTSLYFAVEGKFFSQEEPITPAGNEIFVKREYFKLAGRETLLKGLVYDREPLRDGETVKSGERVECVVTVEAKNNYEYLLFEDLKPAGFEAVEIRSGESLYAKELKVGQASSLSMAGKMPAPPPEAADFTGRTRWVYQELRDRKTALFIDHLPQGVWQIRYDYRAEVPGKFHALPVLGQAMYVPELRANSAELRVNVEEAHAE